MQSITGLASPIVHYPVTAVLNKVLLSQFLPMSNARVYFCARVQKALSHCNDNSPTKVYARQLESSGDEYSVVMICVLKE